MGDSPPQLLGSYDYYSPFATAAIVNKKSGKRYPLTAAAVAKNSDATSTQLKLNGVTAGGMQEYTLDFLPFLTQISVHIDAGVVPRITATLNPPLDIARALIDPNVDVFEWGGVSELEVQIGYSAGLGSGNKRAVSPVFRGLIMQPNFSYDGDDFTITFEAQGQGGWLLATTAGTKMPAGTMQATIQALCEKLKVTLELDIDDATKPLLERQIDGYALGSYSYLSAIYDLARRCGCSIFLRDEPDKSVVTVRSFGKMLLGEPVGTLALLAGLKNTIGPTTGVYPILSVSTDHTAVFLPSTLKTQFTASIREDGKVKAETISLDVDPIPTSNQGAVGIKDPSTETSSTPANGKGQGSSDKAADASLAKKQVVQSILQASAINGRIGMKLEIETLGFPEVQPGMSLNVAGMGGRFDGNYIVMEVTHEYSSSGLSTNLSLVSNSSKIWGSLRNTLPTLDPNIHKAPAPTAVDTTAGGPKATVEPTTQEGAK